MELSPEQVLLVGLIAGFLVQGFKLASARWGEVIHRRVITVILFVIGLVLAYVFTRPALPALPAIGEDPAVFAGLVLVFAGELISVAAGIVGFATVIYNLLLQKVFERLGWTSENVIKSQ